MADPVSLALVVSAAAGATSTVMASRNRAPAAPPPPDIKPPAPMPVPDDEASLAARRREMSGLSQRSGRASTILSETKLGGSKEKLA